MDYRGFLNEVEHNVLKFMPAEYETAKVKIDAILKNNNVLKHGISFHKEGEIITPKVYLEEYFQSYENGASMEEVYTRIANDYLKNTVKDQAFDIQVITDFEQVKDQITTKVVGAKYNKSMLCDRPNTKLDDLAVLYQVEIMRSELGKATIPITHQIMENWNVTLTDLHKLAVDNTERLNPTCLVSLESVLFGMEENFLNPENSYEDSTMLVLTNEDRIGGAATLANQDVLNKVSHSIDDSFYILPSSVHEVLIIPQEVAKGMGMTPKELGAMVREINANEVSREEQLSDHIYKFDKESKSLETVKASKEKKKELER